MAPSLASMILTSSQSALAAAVLGLMEIINYEFGVWGISYLYSGPVWSRLKACTFSSTSAGPLRKDAPSWCRAPFEPEGLLRSHNAHDRMKDLTALLSYPRICMMNMKIFHSHGFASITEMFKARMQ